MNKISLYIISLCTFCNVALCEYDPYAEYESKRLDMMRQQLAEEYYDTQIQRQRLERIQIQNEAYIREQQAEQYRISTEHSRNEYRYDNNYNNINTINQSANTMYNIAAQIKNISDLLK